MKVVIKLLVLILARAIAIGPQIIASVNRTMTIIARPSI
jgi:hypothetical protein